VDIKYKVWYYNTVHRPIKTGEVECLLPEESYSPIKKEAEPKLRNGQDEF
jgi:hypothetical protein